MFSDLSLNCQSKRFHLRTEIILLNSYASDLRLKVSKLKARSKLNLFLVEFYSLLDNLIDSVHGVLRTFLPVLEDDLLELRELK